PVRKGRDTLAGLFASGMALASDVEVNVLAAFPSGNCRALDHDRSDQSREGGEGRGQRRAIGTPQRSARHLREAGAAAKFLRTGSAICAVHESGFGPKRTYAAALHMSAFGGKAAHGPLRKFAFAGAIWCKAEMAWFRRYVRFF